MGLNQFVISKPRPLPVFILADVSGSMKGEKIATLNASLKEMLSELKKLEDVRGAIQLGLITFGGGVKVVQPLTSLNDVTLTALEAGGNTPMGLALDKLTEIIEDKESIPSRAFLPTVALLSDGLPTDIPGDIYRKIETGQVSREDFLLWEPLKHFHESNRGSKCQRLALGIGDDASFEMLGAFINRSDTPVIKSIIAEGISKFLRFVTVSVCNRSVSRNPDKNFFIPLDEFKEAELEF